ncbi:MAG: hypothetical protein J6S14_11680 [Clostridia bacterium]|nr:hypothetical protein [Clostridia bacterium]
MRDRLVEIVDKAKEEYAGDVTDHTETDYIVEGLLNNGAILLSCKVGDKVYENYRGHIFEYVITSIEISSSYDIVYKVRAAEQWNRWVRFIGFDKYDIGKTIFLTREEAEKGGVEG